MKRYATALLFCTLSLTSLAARADIIDDAIGNIQQAINDAYNPGSSRSDDDDRYDDDGRYDDGRYQGSRQLSVCLWPSTPTVASFHSELLV
ncbi:hypothetical protein V4043_003579 [Klebsiella pneumoniae]